MVSSLMYIYLKCDHMKDAPKKIDEMFERDMIHWRAGSKFVVAYVILTYIMASSSVSAHCLMLLWHLGQHLPHRLGMLCY